MSPADAILQKMWYRDWPYKSRCAPRPFLRLRKSQIIVTADGAASEALDGERKTVTALFADIKGSTELMEDLDPEEARAIIDPALKLMIDAAHRYDGYVVQSTGDGIFALFGAPVAHEDHPQRALYAALADAGGVETLLATGCAQTAGADRGARRRQHRRGGSPLDHDRRGSDRVHADRAYHQSRLADAGAGADRVDRGQRDRRASWCEGYFVLKPLRTDQGQRRQRAGQRLRGDRTRAAAHAIATLGRARADQVRRARARDGGAQACRRAGEIGPRTDRRRDGGAGRRQVAAVLRVQGDVAVGLDGAGDVFGLARQGQSPICRCSICLHGYFKIAGEDDERTRREKVTGRFSTLDRSLEDTLPYLFSLLGIVEGDDPLAQMDGQIKKRRTLEAIKRILLRESLNQPLMVIFEDLHWIDEATQEFLNLLADSIGTAKILLLVNYRPEYSHQWNSKTYYTQLRLDPLGKESADEMLSALLGDGVGAGAAQAADHRDGPKATRSSWKRWCRCCSTRARWCATATVKLTRPLNAAEDSADGAGDSRRAHRPAARRCEGAAADAGRDRARISARR